MGPFRLRRLLTPLALVLGVALLAVAADDAWARGGGGNRFNDGGGGGGGGDGLGAILQLLIYLAFRHPVIGVPLLILFLVASYYGSKRAKTSYTGHTIRRGVDARLGNRDRVARRVIEKHDPTFDENAFLVRVERSFITVQRAWCAQDLGPMLAFVSDGLHARFELQLAEQRLLGYRDRMEQLKVERSWIIEADVEGPFEVVTVRIRASAADYAVSLKGDKGFVSGSMDVEPFIEYWTFVRRTGAKSGERKGGLIEGQCPNCGATITANQWSQCKHCDAMLRSGEHDWVLTEITQASQWEERAYQRPPGVEQLRRRDPGFGLQHLEDRSSLLFWRWRAALFAGDVGQMGRVATDEFTESLRGDITKATDADGTRRYIGECAVGHATVIGVLNEEGADRAVVELVWSGTDIVVPRSGAPERAGVRPARATLLVLRRPTGERSGMADAFSSAHCRGCGAPEAAGDASECSYCGEAVTAGNAGWVLAGVHAALSPTARDLRSQLHDEPDLTDGDGADPRNVQYAPVIHKAEVLSWMARVAAVDGVIAPKERKAIDALAAKTGLRTDEVDRLMRSSRARDEQEGLGPRDAKEARLWLASAARTALADGRISKAEQALLQELVEPYGLLAADTRMVVGKVRAQMFQEARAELTAAKKRR